MKTMLLFVIGILVVVFVTHVLSGCADYPVNIGVQGRYSSWKWNSREGLTGQLDLNKIEPAK